MIVSLVVPDPDTPCPLADSRPCVSVSVTVNVSSPVLPLSARLTPAIAVAWLSAIVCAPGTVSTGPPLAVTAIVCVVARLPKLSFAVSVIGSDPLLGSVSLSVARSAFTCSSDPVIVSLVVPDPDTPCPLADSRPCVSVSVTVNVSSPVRVSVTVNVSSPLLPLSARLTPAIAVA